MKTAALITFPGGNPANDVVIPAIPDDRDLVFPKGMTNCHRAIIGMTGSGKTFTAKLHAEQLLSNPNRRVCVIDPTGAWWGMRLLADGVTPSPYSIIIMGGEHGDRPLSPDMGGILGRIVARSKLSVIFDLSLMTQDEQRRFVGDFLTEVYQHNRKPLQIIIDEADEFAPQNAGMKTCKDALIRVMQRSRIRKIAVTLITQRPARIDKTALAQANATIVLRFAVAVDLNKAKEIFSTHPDPVARNRAESNVACLKNGEGWIICQSVETLERRQFSRIATYDSSRSFSSFDDDEEDGETGPVLPQINLAELDNLLSNNLELPPVEGESIEMQLLRAAHDEAKRRLQKLEEQMAIMEREGFAIPDVSLDSNDRLEVDEAMLGLIHLEAVSGNALTPAEIAAKAEVTHKALAHRSILRLLSSGKVTVHNGRLWPSTETLRTLERTGEGLPAPVRIDLTGLVISKQIMSNPELVLHNHLAKAAARLQLYLVPQVAMAAFLDVAPGIDSDKAARAKRAFAGRHVDYILINEDRHVRAVVELDDSSHDVVSDAMRDAVAAAAGIPTIRFSHVKGLNQTSVEQVLRAAIVDEVRDFEHPALRRITFGAANA